MTTTRDYLGWGLLALIGLLMVVGNLAIAPLMQVVSSDDWQAVFVYLSAGSMLAQFAVLSIAAVLLHHAFWLRSLVCLLIGIVLVAAWCLGINLGTTMAVYYYDPWSDVAFTLFSLPWAILAVETPFWLLRLHFRWEVVHQSTQGQVATSRGWAIRDLLVATVLVGVALSAARIAMGIGPIEGVEYWTRLAIGFLVISGVSALTAIPAVVATMRYERLQVPLLLLLAHAGLVVAFCVALIPLLLGLGWLGWSLWLLASIGTLVGSWMGLTTLTLLALRLLGYRLVWGQRATAVRDKPLETPRRHPLDGDPQPS